MRAAGCSIARSASPCVDRWPAADPSAQRRQGHLAGLVGHRRRRRGGLRRDVRGRGATGAGRGARPRAAPSSTASAVARTTTTTCRLIGRVLPGRARRAVHVRRRRGGRGPMGDVRRARRRCARRDRSCPTAGHAAAAARGELCTVTFPLRPLGRCLSCDEHTLLTRRRHHDACTGPTPSSWPPSAASMKQQIDAIDGVISTVELVARRHRVGRARHATSSRGVEHHVPQRAQPAQRGVRGGGQRLHQPQSTDLQRVMGAR